MNFLNSRHYKAIFFGNRNIFLTTWLALLKFWSYWAQKSKQVGSGAPRSLYSSPVKGFAFSRGAPLFNFVLGTNHRVY
jgi:hypothetical protein